MSRHLWAGRACDLVNESRKHFESSPSIKVINKEIDLTNRV